MKEILHISRDVTYVTHYKDILVVGSNNGNITIFCKKFGKFLQLNDHKNEINGLLIHNDLLFSSSDDCFMVYKNRYLIYRHKTASRKRFHLMNDILYFIYNERIDVLQIKETCATDSGKTKK